MKNRNISAPMLIAIGLILYGSYYVVGGFVGSTLAVVGAVMFLFGVAGLFRKKQYVSETDSKILEVGKDIQWSDTINTVFRVLDFDRNGTEVTDNGNVKAASPNKPYGYLRVESPAVNQQIGLPIIHRDDFVLATTVYDEQAVYKHVQSGEYELLVIYAPKHESGGYSASPHHVLHYALVPSGTLEQYYAEHRQEPESVFGKFTYDGEIKVVKRFTVKL